MRNFLLSLNGRLQLLLICFLTIGGAFLIASTCSMLFDIDQLTHNSDLISSVYQVMGTMYAILLTFTLWGVWQHFTEADVSVQNEICALLDLVHMLEASTTFQHTNIRQAVLNYSLVVIEKEWPTLKNLTNSRLNTNEVMCDHTSAIVKVVQAIKPQDARDTAIFSQVLELLNAWLNARRARMLIARGNNAKALWPLLLTGAFVLFAFNGLFAATEFSIWSALLFGTSFVIATTFYLIFSLDCPFEGSLSIDSEPFTLVVTLLKENKNVEEVMMS